MANTDNCSVKPRAYSLNVYLEGATSVDVQAVMLGGHVRSDVPEMLEVHVVLNAEVFRSNSLCRRVTLPGGMTKGCKASEPQLVGATLPNTKLPMD